VKQVYSAAEAGGLQLTFQRASGNAKARLDRHAPAFLWAILLSEQIVRVCAEVGCRCVLVVSRSYEKSVWNLCGQ
jgi:hypothetical protein